jgi:hypothetical protein
MVIFSPFPFEEDGARHECMIAEGESSSGNGFRLCAQKARTRLS